jgi:hypothetical protein
LALRALLAAGRLTCSRPVILAHLQRPAGARWREMTASQHLWFLTEEAFRRWAGRLGLRVEACQHPWKLVPLSLIAFQLGRMIGWRQAAMPGSRLGVRINLFDAMRVVFRKGTTP